MEFLNAFTFQMRKIAPSLLRVYLRKYLSHFQLQKSLTKKISVFYHEFFSVLLKLNFFRILSIQLEQKIRYPFLLSKLQMFF